MQALQRIAEDIKGISIDAVLYMDRLDLYRVDPLDQSVSPQFLTQSWTLVWVVELCWINGCEVWMTRLRAVNMLKVS